MPYILSPLIKEKSPGMWNEGDAYTKKSIYSIQSGQLPPVNYDEHTLRAHSLTHMETPAHTQENGNRIGYYYQNDLTKFYGRVLLIKLKGNNYKPVENMICVFHWIISLDELKARISDIALKPFSKILITSEFCPLNTDGYHDPNYVLTLSEEAAAYLVDTLKIELYGTSWKSSDFNPGSKERPIHKKLFGNGLILENLVMSHVPEGEYFLNAFPLPIDGASEAPVVPVLFKFEELN